MSTIKKNSNNQENQNSSSKIITKVSIFEKTPAKPTERSTILKNKQGNDKTKVEQIQTKKSALENNSTLNRKKSKKNSKYSLGLINIIN